MISSRDRLRIRRWQDSPYTGKRDHLRREITMTRDVYMKRERAGTPDRAAHDLTICAQVVFMSSVQDSSKEACNSRKAGMELFHPAVLHSPLNYELGVATGVLPGVPSGVASSCASSAVKAPMVMSLSSSVSVLKAIRPS